MRKNIAEKPFSSKRFVPYKLITEYLSDIFEKAKEQDGYICVRSGPDSYAAQSWIDVNSLENLKIELSRHDYRNTFFSFSTFKKKRKPQRKIDNVQNIYAWSIDVDYKNEVANPLDVYEFIMENVNLPKPNYIEYGHRLRMIYIFEEPLRLYAKQRTQLLNGFHFLQRAFCKIINEQLGFMGESFGAEANPASSFFRVPGSVNMKDGSTIQIKKITDEKWTMQELFYEWIPDSIKDESGNKEKWYDSWKKSDNNTIAKKYNSKTLWEKRMNIFMQLRSVPNSHRKRLCFYYGVGITQIYGRLNPDEFMKKLSDFNNGFINPLSEHILRRVFSWQANTQPLYRFTDQTLADNLEVNREYFSLYSRKEKDAERYQQKRNAQLAKGKAKCQQMKKRQSKVFDLLNAGKSLTSIAQKMKVSVSTIKRDIEAIKNGSLIQNEILDNLRQGGASFVSNFPVHTPRSVVTQSAKIYAPADNKVIASLKENYNLEKIKETIVAPYRNIAGLNRSVGWGYRNCYMQASRMRLMPEPP